MAKTFTVYWRGVRAMTFTHRGGSTARAASATLAAKRPDLPADGTVTLAVHMRGGYEGAPFQYDPPPRCPVCDGPMPDAARDRRVAYDGTVVCDRASCESEV